MKTIVIAIILIVMFILAIALGAQNEQLVSVNYLVAQQELRLSWLMAGCFIAGVLVAFMSIALYYFKQSFERSKLKRKVSKQQVTIEKLQNQNLKV
ncbi:DUF1049 domain-containing protein [Alginatibacterium sediminis]|uniref:Probable lipopolysaccharide assembly protein A n=1 Tax=Alginatibacterium sediminis TaxID=2164068 RepID=A0A420EG60_9ALTE|nr:lipopolysaccharide assembly protein LapA domain-containing protein [Alginatibacterium sediminis]RKF19658.1 DUF1049 domain-containing protein [Alginatibacterium sediminis]